jgi:hypothetical protein
MTPARNQLAKEARYDVKVAVVGLALFFGCLSILPRSAFWFYFVPLAAFWFRYLWVRNRRDDALLRADLAADGGLGAAGCYRSEAGICITDGTHHVLVARDDAKPPLQLPHIVGRK